jgi:von Willebrand factor type D domain/Bacterial Ig domain/RTX calcium-binding nonapeptide repeat (4 copies)
VATLNGTSNDDLLFLPTASTGNELLGLEGNDSLDATTGAGNNILRGGDGNDELFALTNDQLFGDLGNDSLYSDGNGSNSLYGGDGNDSLFADRNDSIFGDAGDDLIFGGIGGNKLTGGTGKDLFYLTPNGVPQAVNEVLDFTKNDDKILITAIPEIKTFADLIRVQVGADTVLRANIGGTVQDIGILKNIQADTLNPADFNRAPVANLNKTLVLLEDAGATSLGITAPTDPDGDTLTVTVSTIPDANKGEIRLSNGTAVALGSTLTPTQLTDLVFVPAPNANGSAGILSYTVSDSKGGSAKQEITLSITPVNDAPVADPNKTLTVLEDSAPSPLGIKAPTDVDGDALTITVSSLPDATKGQIRLSDRTVVTAGSLLTVDQLTNLVFAPVANRSLDAGSFAYTVNDGNGGIATQTISLSITPDNDGGAIGDPHLMTFDGFHYDFQATGDFLLLRGLDSNLEVQTRQMPWVYNPATTINTALATVVDGNRVEFYVDQPLPLIDKQPFSLDVGQSQALGQGNISRTAISGYGVPGDLYTLTHANGDELKISVYKDFLIDVNIDLAGTKSVMGLLGNNNGNSEDDLSLRDGTSLTHPLAPENLYGAFSNSWQVPENESLFSLISPIDLARIDASSQQNDLDALAKRFIFGGNGDDILIGVDSTLVNPGKGEVDLLMGNKGGDTFVLGDRSTSYYVGLGSQDYALITDLWAEDRIQLHGSASNYVLGSAPTGLANGTGIFLAQNPNELVGIVQGQSIANLDLSNASVFYYV